MRSTNSLLEDTFKDVNLLKNEKIIQKEMINKKEPVEWFYTKIGHFFKWM